MSKKPCVDMASKSLFLRVLLLSLCISSSSSSDPLRPDERASHDYLRFAEVERHCRPVLSSATLLAYDVNRGSDQKNGLASFEKGDWLQDVEGHAPLMPFDGSDVPSGGARRHMAPLSLATFMLTHVDLGRLGGERTTAFNASGVLELSISRKSQDAEISSFRRTTTPVSSPEFKISPGAAKLRIKFEGVYTETAKGNGGGGEGERVLCMVGSALLPTRSTGGGADPWDWAKDSGRSGFLPPVRADDNILLVLRFPIKATLTTRAVVGEMRSTGAASAAAYFDPVRLVSSQLCYSPYQYQSEELVADACSPLPSIESSDIVGSRGGKLFNGSYLCGVLERYSNALHGVVTSPSAWQCSSTSTTLGSSCRSLGPFEMDRAAGQDELNEVGIVMKDLQCSTDSSGNERVSVVLRALPPWEDRYTAAQRSGLSGLTLSAEGVWMPSAGKACLVACRGTGDKECHFRMCLYIPMTLSITDRSIVLGQVTSVNATGAGGVSRSSSSLSFQLSLYSPRYWGYNGPWLALEYNYTKAKLAGELLRRGESRFSLRKITASSLMPIRYPRADFDARDYNSSLYHLAGELTLRFTTAPSMFRPGWLDQPVVHLEIIFVEQVSNPQVRHASRARASPKTSEEGSMSKMTQQHLINVSAELNVFGRYRVATSAMSLEGVYDPDNGRMQLIGCRDVRRLRQPNLSANDGDLEEGMDCSIEVRVDYPPTNTQWFIWSTAKVRIGSTRDASDPLHFHTMKLQAIPTHYSKSRPDDVNRAIVNGVLGIVLLSASIAAGLSQLRHLKAHADVAPYVSLVMVCVQALGLGMPLITGIEALVAKATIRGGGGDTTAMPPSSSSSTSYALIMNQLYRSIDQAGKVLSLAAFVVTLRLAQKVHRSRARMLARSPLEPGRVPGDAKVLACHYAAHLAIFLLILAQNGEAMTVEQHVALLQDLFLLPQVVANALWRINCRPLAESYYLGVTAVRLLSHLYELVRPPPWSVVYSHQYLNARQAVFSSAWDVAVPAGAVLLGVVVYVQQRWNYAIVSRMGMAEQRKLQHII